MPVTICYNVQVIIATEAVLDSILKHQVFIFRRRLDPSDIRVWWTNFLMAYVSTLDSTPGIARSCYNSKPRTEYNIVDHRPGPPSIYFLTLMKLSIVRRPK